MKEICELMENIRDLARTGTPPMSFAMTEKEWMQHKLNKIARMANYWIEKNCYIHDGFDCCWYRWCSDCGAEMQIIRPGEARCSDECDRLEDEHDKS